MPGPWEKYGAQSSQPSPPGVIYGPPPQEKPPTIPSGYERDPNGGIRPMKGGPADPTANLVNTPGDTTLSGDAYLKTIPANLAGQVKALAEGRRAFPTGTALKNPQIQELIAAATQYDPTLDATNSATRVATRKDFTSGRSRRNMTSINTAIGHIATLKQLADQLDNSSFPLWNSVANTAETAFGDKRIKQFNLARDAVANELMRVFRGVGSGSVQEIEDWKSSISSSDSPEQLHAEIQTALDLLNSRLLNMQDQYRAGMGYSADVYQFLSPHSRELLNNLAPGMIPEGTGAGEQGKQPADQSNVDMNNPLLKGP